VPPSSHPLHVRAWRAKGYPFSFLVLFALICNTKPILAGIYTQWNFMQPWRIMKCYNSQVNGWN
jgi:hypothetical protein